MKPLRIVLLLFLTGLLRAAVVPPNTDLTEREQQIIDAVHPVAVPYFNGTQVIGVRPGTALLHALAVTSKRPLMFSSKSLPRSLELDSQTGIISGILTKPGEYKFRAIAQNSNGRAAVEIKILCGDTLALTPPMGWNSYNAFGDSVRESEVLSNAIWLKENLQPLV
ncbi:MAG TPA: putative Ig domain-containing protein [Candidatus Saccharimonadales bacterium]|nr:putative Ig domain-containing protein [Candidatus Saccharimonadales bacterium]